MEEILHNRIIGQQEAVRSVAKAIRRARVGLKDPKSRSVPSYFRAYGSRKDGIIKSISRGYVWRRRCSDPHDMSEYMEKHTVSGFRVAPGYVGFDEGGQLTNRSEKPYSVILFDEIEKAHPDIF